MRHGLSERTLATLRGVLDGHPEVERALLYGSRAKGEHRAGSDIDLALVGDAVDSRVCAQVWQKLDASAIPYEVDVTGLATLTHEPLIEHIHRVGLEIYLRSTDAAAP